MTNVTDVRRIIGKKTIRVEVGRRVLISRRVERDGDIPLMTSATELQWSTAYEGEDTAKAGAEFGHWKRLLNGEADLPENSDLTQSPGKDQAKLAQSSVKTSGLGSSPLFWLLLALGLFILGSGRVTIDLH